jgi:protein XRP2
MIDQCKNTKMVIGPVKGSVFFRDCDNCTIQVACQQFRCRDLTNSSVMLYAANDPVIEASSNLKFGPFNLSYPKLGEHAAAAELNPNENKWELVFDFTDKGSPNYTVIPPAEWKTEVLNLPDSDAQPEAVFDYPKRYGGNASDEPPESSAEHNAFGITTG